MTSGMREVVLWQTDVDLMSAHLADATIKSRLGRLDLPEGRCGQQVWRESEWNRTQWINASHYFWCWHGIQTPGRPISRQPVPRLPCWERA